MLSIQSHSESTPRLKSAQSIQTNELQPDRVAAVEDVSVSLRGRGLVDDVGLGRREVALAAERERVGVAVEGELGEAGAAAVGVGVSLFEQRYKGGSVGTARYTRAAADGDGTHHRTVYGCACRGVDLDNEAELGTVGRGVVRGHDAALAVRVQDSAQEREVRVVVERVRSPGLQYVQSKIV